MYLCISGAAFVVPYSFGYLVPLFIFTLFTLNPLKRAVIEAGPEGFLPISVF
jgi:hypothetical protein